MQATSQGAVAGTIYSDTTKRTIRSVFAPAQTSRYTHELTCWRHLSPKVVRRMWNAAMRVLKDWYILALGLAAITGAFSYASFSTSSSMPTPTLAKPSTYQASEPTVAVDPKSAERTAEAETAIVSPPPAPVEIAQAEAPTPVAALQGPTASAGDATAGRQVYKKCKACHSLEAGKNRVGPSLAGIIGRQSASVPGFS